MRFANRTIIVTGAAAGIGLASVGLLLEEGASVVLADIDEAALEAVIAGMPQAYAKRVSPVVCDVANVRQVDALTGHAMGKFGHLDAIICAATKTVRAPFSELKEDDFDSVIRTNLKGTFLCVKAAAKAMVEQRDRGREILGSIVVFSADSAFQAIPHNLPLLAAAGGVERLVTSMARGFAHADIRINAVAVGMADTGLLRKAVGSGKAGFNAGMARMAQARLHDADEIAKIAAFLASNEASAITGQIIGTGAD